MKIEDIKENYYFETLTAEHDLSDFDCGDEDLNDFLKNDALAQQKEKLNVTKLVMYNGDIIGFASLLTDTLKLKNIKDENLRLKIKGKLNINSNKRGISAVKIGRLAINRKYSNKGLGSHILRSILNNLKKISENKVGFRFIIIEGYAKAFNFYVVRNGFEYLKKDEKSIKNIDFIMNRDPTKTFYLYLDLEKI
ncbi:GNAT family N-acetyltransferase [uncultured Methanobrevibacter sp.]|uniref:GNAT family N-acetyltransferase n=1 Tax=uncultured Methanobrevibacter sp. TaxID=253161 RepID=UPI0026127453|nr:GNAT family N-acetyltransferase [uncultured Methanobrevibacter sp.]